ncbi:MAG: nickel pincer cofactor biosynthesis protein LarB [Coriobacteriaceae bacterium]|nr:nickel pincer cofactor biosynthesis protein LarB [Coriobacteriaceae bacterium]
MNLDDFADLDFDRAKRCGFPEVIYAASKTPEQIAAIAQALLAEHGIAFATRVKDEAVPVLRAAFPDACWFERSRVFLVDRRKDPLSGATFEELLACPNRAAGNVVVACAGTSDLPVAEEAALTARIMGSHVEMLVDVGVAGVHRTLQHLDELQSARAIVVVAGMEGALASLIGGLVDVPVVAVPTSVGYGASFGGIAALLGMLNSCAGGVSVVNIDNGFGAGQIADRINRPPARFTEA